MNCPRLCDFCNCKNNPDSFTLLGSGESKTCDWVGKDDTFSRCDNYPVVKRNCPLSCGECDDFIFPSDAPSPSPSIKLYPTINIVTKTTIPVNTTIPTDPTELETYKAVLIEAFSEFTPAGTVVTDVNVYYTDNILSRTTTSASAVVEFISEDSFTCSSDSCDETLAAREAEMTQVAVNVSLPGTEGLKGSVDSINESTGTNVEIRSKLL